ncbi:MAG: archaeosine biosynthesis radical SAM protein RaSEA [Candidatus Thermoplasmatota archaeon]|nr:archaeosine biosynthesis radical SAM protein RaSEA [Candidatus Thermoplasmatota archaeon]
MIHEGGTSNSKPLSVWKEKDSIDRVEVEALVMILKTRGCSWSKRSGCTMCGYNNSVFPDVTSSDLIMQVDDALKSYDGEQYIKIFTSGSYFDPMEIPLETQRSIAMSVGSSAPSARLLVETRPEFINRQGLEQVGRYMDILEVAIGLETSSDNIRMENINKGFTWSDYIRGGRIVDDTGCLLKTYLLMKSPFMSEAASIGDCLNSIKDVHEEFPGSRISVNPMNIQSRTLVERLFRKGLYRPPWLWSLMEVLGTGTQLTKGETLIMSSPTAGGKKRGVHNCGECDPGILEAISSFSIDNDRKLLLHHYHHCMEDWKEHIALSVSDPLYSDMWMRSRS